METFLINSISKQQSSFISRVAFMNNCNYFRNKTGYLDEKVHALDNYMLLFCDALKKEKERAMNWWNFQGPIMAALDVTTIINKCGNLFPPNSHDKSDIIMDIKVAEKFASVRIPSVISCIPIIRNVRKCVKPVYRHHTSVVREWLTKRWSTVTDVHLLFFSKLLFMFSQSKRLRFIFKQNKWQNCFIYS